MNEYERLDQVRMRAQLLEDKAMQDEKLIRNTRNTDAHENVERSMAVNDMYMEAIQAKLKLLDHI